MTRGLIEKKMIRIALLNTTTGAYESYLDTDHDHLYPSRMYEEEEKVRCLSTRYYGRGSRNATAGECFEEDEDGTWRAVDDGKWIRVEWNGRVLGDVFLPLDVEPIDYNAFPYPMLRLPHPIGMGPFHLYGAQFRDIRSTRLHELCALHFRLG